MPTKMIASAASAKAGGRSERIMKPQNTPKSGTQKVVLGEEARALTAKQCKHDEARSGGREHAEQDEREPRLRRGAERPWFVEDEARGDQQTPRPRSGSSPKARKGLWPAMRFAAIAFTA